MPSDAVSPGESASGWKANQPGGGAAPSGRQVMSSAYREDLAYIHDAGFGGIATSAAPVLRDALRRRGIVSGLVIDLGCGSGILSEAMSAAGHDVLGIDISGAMLALA